MDYKSMSLDALKKELGSCEQQIKVNKANIAALAEELGINPTLEVIESKIEEVKKEKADAEKEMESIVDSLNKLDLDYSGEFERDSTVEEQVVEQDPNFNDFD